MVLPSNEVIMEAYTQRRLEAKAKGITCKYSTVLSEFQSRQEPVVRQQQSNNNQQIGANDDADDQERRPKNNFDLNQEPSNYQQTATTTLVYENQQDQQVLVQNHPSTITTSSEVIEKFESTTITTLAVTTTTTTTTTTSKHESYFDGITIPRKRRTERVEVPFPMQEKPQQHEVGFPVQEKHPQHCKPVPEQQNKMKKNKQLVDKKKRKKRTLPQQSSMKRQKKDPSEPEMPVHIREAINRLGGKRLTARWVAQKKLTASDVNPHQTRLFFPRCESLEEFMTEHELKKHRVSAQTAKKTGRHRHRSETILPLIDPAGAQSEIDFRIWSSLNKCVFTSSSWKNFVSASKLKAESDTLQIWSFRLPPERGSKLCFAMNRIRKS